MDNARINSNPTCQPEELYICNISRWVSKKNMNSHASKYNFSTKGVVSYKFIGKSHLPSNYFSFVEFSQDKDALKAYEAVRTLESDKNEREEKLVTEKKEITEPMTLIEKLDDDCLIKIFLYLPMEKRLEMENVCVRWRYVSRRAWHDIQELEVCNHFYSGTFSHSKFIKKVLMRCGVYLKSLKLDRVCSSHMLLVIRRYCHNLTEIGLEFTKCNVQHYNAFSKMKKLQSFALKSTETRFVMNCLLSLSKTVQLIDIDASTRNSWKFASLPACVNSNFEKLEALDSLTMKGFIFREDLIEAISKKETITKLILTCNEIKKGLNVLSNLSNLEYLDLYNIEVVDNDFLICLSTKCKKIKYLDLSYCRQLSDRGIRELQNLDNLEVLMINHMTASVTDIPLGQLKGIKILECEECIGVGDPGTMQLLVNCPSLEKLNIGGTLITENTLQFATRVTKSRRNSVILSLVIDSNQIKYFRNEEYEYSPLLKLEGTDFDASNYDSEDYNNSEDDLYDGYESEDNLGENDSTEDDSDYDSCRIL